MGLPPAGWYPDPSGAARLRYFDGTRWTDHFGDAGPPQGAYSERQPATIPAGRSPQAAGTPVQAAAVPFGAGGVDKGVTKRRHPAARVLVFFILAIVGFSSAVAGFVKLMYVGGSEIYPLAALLVVLAADVGALISANLRAAKAAVRLLLIFLILAIVGYLMAVAGFVVQVTRSYSIGDGIKSVGALLFIVGIVGAIISAIVSAAKRSPAVRIYSPVDQQGGLAPRWYPGPQAMDTVRLPSEPPSAPSGRRSRAPWIIAGAVAVVAVAAFVWVTPASRQVVLPFTGLKEAYGVAVDGAGNVYVVDSGNSRVLKLPKGATSQTELPFTGLNHPYRVAVDGAGDVYVADTGNSRVLKLPTGATSQVVLPFTGLAGPTGVAVDGAGNVYTTSGRQVLKLPAGTTTQVVLPFTGLSNIDTVAVDGAGNVYVVDSPLNDRLLKLPSGSTAQTELSPPPQAFTQCPAAMAVDTAGTVYALCGDYQVYKLPTGSGTWTVLPFTDLGINPGLAVDTAGNLYTTRGTAVLKLSVG